MGNLKCGWSRGAVVVIIAIGFLFAGIFVSNYFQAKASNQPINHQKNESLKSAYAKGPIVKDTNDLKLEKERIFKQSKEVMFWRNMQDREKNSVLETSTTPINATKISTHDTAPQTPTKKSDQVQAVPNNPPIGNTSSEKSIFLTFDDGPSPFSSEIIALLENYHFKATFFMIDGNIRKYPDAVKLMVQSGETVGLHSVSHDQKLFYASATSVMAELTQNRNTLKEISGIDSYIMRTPYGSVPYMTEEDRKVVNENGYLMWDWNVDSRDWDYKDGRYVNSVIEQLNKLTNHRGPLVILLHERKETVAHLPQLLDFLTSQGFKGKAIDNTMTPVQFKN
ncbi:polysaccharide deacetylase family protein [Neobacillus jeddahensis]|uniref:polysaccharide deacetylase family protein n=1 Tax=Neobacillus jeddahensis TaxID=1461580 RepID=UPI000694BAC1|nr:polysaccharide deacetylase family protein [Neobacillus jeddahensis]